MRVGGSRPIGPEAGDQAYWQVFDAVGDGLIVQDTQAQLEAISKLAGNLNGYIASSSTQKFDEGLQARLTLRVPALAGSYEILINVVENQAPRFCRLAGSARGPAGGVQGEGTFMLAPDVQKTVIAYDGEAQLTGPLGGMHPRFAEGVAQTLIRQGLNKLAELARARQGSPS